MLTFRWTAQKQTQQARMRPHGAGAVVEGVDPGAGAVERVDPGAADAGGLLPRSKSRQRMDIIRNAGRLVVAKMTARSFVGGAANTTAS
jgi:hypothetical protein